MSGIVDVAALLRFHVECQQGSYFSELHDVDVGWLAFSDQVRDPYYNLVVPTTDVTRSDCIRQAVEFDRRGRLLTMYASPIADLVDDDGGAQLWARDAWLVAPVDVLDDGGSADEITVATVGPEHRDAYVEAFERAYSGADPGDPYGPLDDAYRVCLAGSFDRDVPGYRRRFVLARSGATPVGVATVFTAGSWAGVYGVGTVPGWRGRGVGRALMAHAARVAAADGARRVMLQTEAGSAPQRWYERLGYETAFVARYLLLTP